MYSCSYTCITLILLLIIISDCIICIMLPTPLRQAASLGPWGRSALKPDPDLMNK